MDCVLVRRTSALGGGAAGAVAGGAMSSPMIRCTVSVTSCGYRELSGVLTGESGDGGGEDRNPSVMMWPFCWVRSVRSTGADQLRSRESGCRTSGSPSAGHRLVRVVIAFVAGPVVLEQVDAVQQGFQCFVEFVGGMVLGQFGFQAFQPRVLR